MKNEGAEVCSHKEVCSFFLHKLKIAGIPKMRAFPYYRRENLFLKALIVLAIIGAISEMGRQE